jgi:2-polyprenyl-6-methoxyphenol hydroxylase-like FAD-dependent oxidoreductase
VTTAAQLPDADLIVASDGINSRIRQEAKGIHTDVHVGNNKYIWPGTDKVFDFFMFPFVQTDSGWIWAHAYGVDPTRAHLSLNAQLKRGVVSVSTRCRPKIA